MIKQQNGGLKRGKTGGGTKKFGKSGSELGLLNGGNICIFLFGEFMSYQFLFMSISAI